MFLIFIARNLLIQSEKRYYLLVVKLLELVRVVGLMRLFFFNEKAKGPNSRVIFRLI